jgi:DNA-binding protein H-NS
MAKSYSQMLKEIEILKSQAAEMRQKEVGGVIARMKEAITFYNLTPGDLFGDGAKGIRRGAKAAGKGSGPASEVAPRYRDSAGNVWGGRGPRPQWLRDALNAGKQLSDFDTAGKAGSGVGNGVVAPKRKKAAAKKKLGGTIRYRDDAGNTWTGFGPKPRWYKEALAAGKSPEQLAA